MGRQGGAGKPLDDLGVGGTLCGGLPRLGGLPLVLKGSWLVSYLYLFQLEGQGRSFGARISSSELPIPPGGGSSFGPERRDIGGEFVADRGSRRGSRVGEEPLLSSGWVILLL